MKVKNSEKARNVRSRWAEEAVTRAHDEERPDNGFAGLVMNMFMRPAPDTDWLRPGVAVDFDHTPIRLQRVHPDVVFGKTKDPKGFDVADFDVRHTTKRFDLQSLLGGGSDGKMNRGLLAFKIATVGMSMWETLRTSHQGEWVPVAISLSIQEEPRTSRVPNPAYDPNSYGQPRPGFDMRPTEQETLPAQQERLFLLLEVAWYERTQRRPYDHIAEHMGRIGVSPISAFAESRRIDHLPGLLLRQRQRAEVIHREWWADVFEKGDPREAIPATVASDKKKKLTAGELGAGGGAA